MAAEKIKTCIWGRTRWHGVWKAKSKFDLSARDKNIEFIFCAVEHTTLESTTQPLGRRACWIKNYKRRLSVNTNANPIAKQLNNWTSFCCVEQWIIFLSRLMQILKSCLSKFHLPGHNTHYLSIFLTAHKWVEIF